MTADLAGQLYDVSLMGSVVIFALVCTVYLRRNLFSVFHPLTWYAAFHGMVFVFRPIVARISEFELVYRAFRFSPTPADKLTVIVAANLGFIAFAAACPSAGDRPMRFPADAAAAVQRRLMTPLFVWVLAICVPLGIYSLSQTWNSAADTGIAFSGMVRDLATGVYINTEGNGYITDAQLMLASCTAIFAWIHRFRLLACLPLAFFILFRAGTGGRGPFITALATAALLLLYERRQRAPTLRVVALAAGALVMFNVVGADRGEMIRSTFGSESPVSGRTRVDERFLEGMDFANLEYFEYLVYAIPQRTGTYGYFTDVLQVVTEPIPRKLWPGKPIGAPLDSIRLFDYGTPIGMTRSLPGAGWYGLGWLGVLLWCGAWGHVLGRLYRRFVDGAMGAPQVIAYTTFLPILIIAFRDGQVVTIFRQGVFFLAPIGLWVVLSRLAGVPSIAAIRAALLRRTGPEALPADAAQSPPSRARADLPPAVRRRRAALASAANQPAVQVLDPG